MAKAHSEMEKRKDLFRAVFSSPEGQNLLAILEQSVRADMHCFVAGDPHHTSFKCGQHSVIHYIKSMMSEKSDKPYQEVTNNE